MPVETPEPQPLLANLGLVASVWNFFVFVIHPALAVGVLELSLLVPIPESLLAFEVRLYFAIGYLVFSMFAAWTTSEKIKVRLTKDRYIQRYTRNRMIDYGFNLAIVAAMYHNMQNSKGSLGNQSIHATFIFCGLWWILFVLSISIGPVIYFTARASSAEELNAAIARRQIDW
jgi:hypothetical protein